MKMFWQSAMSLASRARDLVSRAEATEPALEEVAAMVYVGDVYAVREQPAPKQDDGWGEHCYTCGDSDHL